jgi:hypothetical protein
MLNCNPSQGAQVLAIWNSTGEFICSQVDCLGQKRKIIEVDKSSKSGLGQKRKVINLL